MRRLCTLVFMASLACAGYSTAAPVTFERLLNAENDGANWLSHSRDYAETRFSPLTEINDSNVNQLGLAWAFDMPDKRGLQGTPLVIDGVMYATGNWNKLFALNGASGELLWQYDPKVDVNRANAFCCGVINRGVAAWGNNLYMGTLDGYLVAIDRASGAEVWRTLTIDQNKHYSITGAPRVVNGVVVIGNGGSEYGVRGYVGGYDPDSGEMLWRFYTVPGNPADGFENEQMELAAKTWSGNWWEMGGGGTAWDSFAYDAELDLLYIGVGNGAPHNREMRSPGGGDNLYLSSIVAVKAQTGEYVWHYQQTPADSWDFTATQSLILTDIEWQGQTRQVIMQAPKNGFFFILDRVSGELLSAEPYVPVTWATHYDITTGRPVEAEGAGYVDKPFNLKPTGLGGHNWHPMAYSPDTGLVYIPALDFMAPIENQDEYLFNPRQWNLGYKTNASPFGHIITQAIMRASVDSYLLAWDPVTQREVWRAPNPIIGNGGVLATAGNLVFQGNSANQLVAFDAINGEAIWQFDAQQGIMASPVTYSVDGEQYVAVLAGRGGGLSMMIGMETPPSSTIRRLLVFKLGANSALPQFDDVAARVAPPARMDVTDDELMAGGAKYMALCARCHGAMLVSDGSVPDLRRLDNIWYDKFDDVVLNGMMQEAGMPGFKADLTQAETRNIKAYVLHKANEDWEIENSPRWWLACQTWLAEILASILVFLMQQA